MPVIQPATGPKNGKSAAENELEGALEDFDGEILAERGALKKGLQTNTLHPLAPVYLKVANKVAQMPTQPNNRQAHKSLTIHHRPEEAMKHYPMTYPTLGTTTLLQSI